MYYVTIWSTSVWYMQWVWMINDEFSQMEMDDWKGSIYLCHIWRLSHAGKCDVKGHLKAIGFTSIVLCNGLVVTFARNCLNMVHVHVLLMLTFPIKTNLQFVKANSSENTSCITTHKDFISVAITLPQSPGWKLLLTLSDGNRTAPLRVIWALIVLHL